VSKWSCDAKALLSRHTSHPSVGSFYLHLHTRLVSIFPLEGAFKLVPCQPCLASPQKRSNSTYLPNITSPRLTPSTSVHLIIHRQLPLSVGVPCRSCTYFRYLDTILSSLCIRIFLLFDSNNPTPPNRSHSRAWLHSIDPEQQRQRRL
jgi:hypothetical protein